MKSLISKVLFRFEICTATNWIGFWKGIVEIGSGAPTYVLVGFQRKDKILTSFCFSTMESEISILYLPLQVILPIIACITSNHISYKYKFGEYKVKNPSCISLLNVLSILTNLNTKMDHHQKFPIFPKHVS